MRTPLQNTFRSYPIKTIISLVIGVSLTFASFAYQARVGTWDRLEAGFPFRYVVDSFGVSALDSLGPEDGFIFVLFLQDVLFYAVISYAGIKFVQKFNQRRGQ